MSRYENKVKLREIKKYISKKDYETAQRILDTINLDKLSNRLDMSQIVEVYIENGRYDEALNILYKMYDKLKTRKIIFQLINVSIKLGNYQEAEEFLREYIDLVPEDFYVYIFKYQINKKKGKPLNEQIELLEKLKTIEYIDKWSYELAKLYYKSNMLEECKQECLDIVIWFGKGLYVEKAKILLAYFEADEDKTSIIKELKRKIDTKSKT